MKLKVKIQLYSSIFMLILVLIVNISAYYFFYSMSTNTELDELNLIAEDVVGALNENPEVDPGELMKAYLPANGMIRIITENEVPMLVQTRSTDFLTLPWNFTNTEHRSIISQNQQPDIAVVERPMIWSAGEHKGEVMTIQVSNHLNSLHETMRTLLYVLGVLSIVVLIPVILASSLLSRFLLSPIQILISTMKKNMNQDEWETIHINHRSRDELFEMERTFNEMIEHLKTSYEKQEMFVSDASHELKTPIQIIKGYAQLLGRRDHIPPELMKESIEAIDSETDRIKKLVEQMLSMAKNKQLRPQEEVDVTSLVEETVATFQEAFDRSIELYINESPLFVIGNKGQIEQVIYILIDNAIKYSEKQIEVHIYYENENVMVQVKDYGQGISSEEQKRIFDRFYRVDKARSRDTGGTGLGLSIALDIAKGHGGNLLVESDMKKGSTFTFILRTKNTPQVRD